MKQARHVWALLTMTVMAGGPARAAEVVANPSYSDASIARPLLRGVFGMRVRAWPDGTPVRVFVLEDHNPVHQEFTKSVLQMYPYQLRQNWDRLLYSGTGQQPVTVGSEDELLRRVAETPGAIGYLRQAPPASASAQSGKGRSEPTRPAVKVLHVR
jgi:hypothetical protein